MPQTLVPQTVLITGPTSGIGYELAKLFALDGYRLVLVGRTKTVLEKVLEECRQLGATEGSYCISADLAQPDSPRAIFAEVTERGCAIDVLVNNAGFGLLGDFSELDAQKQTDMIQVNVAAVTQLTRLFLPGMLARKAGRILNVASTAAYQPGPGMAVYYATKAYVLSFSQAISYEVRGTGVTVTALCPGATGTHFHQTAGLHNSPVFRRPMAATTVAQIGYSALKAGRPVAITGFRNWLGTIFARMVPAAWAMIAVERLHKQEIAQDRS